MAVKKLPLVSDSDKWWFYYSQWSRTQTQPRNFFHGKKQSGSIPSNSWSIAYSKHLYIYLWLRCSGPHNYRNETTTKQFHEGIQGPIKKIELSTCRNGRTTKQFRYTTAVRNLSRDFIVTVVWQEARERCSQSNTGMLENRNMHFKYFPSIWIITREERNY